MLELFGKGLLLGFSIAAPVGPIGILCIRRTLAYGRVSGFVSGLGAATADACYGAVAAFGLTAVSNWLLSFQSELTFIGGVFLCYLGWRLFFARASGQSAEAGRTGLISDYLSTVGLTITNPMTILSFAAVFAGMGLGNAGGDYASAAVLVLGVAIGSSLWWLTLSSAVHRLRERFSLDGIRWVNQLSGGILFLFGLAAFFSFIQG